MDTGYETRILRIVSRKGKEARLILEENRFHVSGGGQPGDKGRLAASGFSAEVTDCFRDGEEEVLAVRILQGEPAEGLAVLAEVDQDRQRPCGCQLLSTGEGRPQGAVQFPPELTVFTEK